MKLLSKQMKYPVKNYKTTALIHLSQQYTSIYLIYLFIFILLYPQSYGNEKFKRNFNFITFVY